MKKKWFVAELVLLVGILMGCSQPFDTYREDETTAETTVESAAWESIDTETFRETIQGETETAEVAECFSSMEILPEGEIFERINGCSYQENDNIPLEELRYVQVLYYGFDGETHMGELIVNREIAEDVLEIFQELYEAQYPIERMELVDNYGGDDEASMAANNTSAFNYRTISGTSRLSNHSYGKAIDLNPFYNPYVYTSKDGQIHCEPAEAVEYEDRSKDFPHKIDQEDLAWKLFTAHGFSWGGDWNTRKDYQHFEKIE